MNRSIKSESGFTLIEIAIVLLIVTILLGYTVALFPRQQELKQFRAADQEMDEIISAIIGFAQVNGRLPCPAIPNGVGREDGGGTANCNNYGGFVPVNTLGLIGRLNGDSLLMDPWGNPYRYYVSASDFDDNKKHDFVRNGEMQSVGLIDSNDDEYIDLDGQFVICDQGGVTINQVCDSPANTVFGRVAPGPGPFAGAPFVLVSHGKDWNQGDPTGDQLANMGKKLSKTDLKMPDGPTTKEYRLKNIGGIGGIGGSFPETTFVKRLTGQGDGFDDIVKWVSPSTLFSKMIEADQLP
jgi:prepilin-type N-terminal cleavage/methylation domain-containing protein